MLCAKRPWKIALVKLIRKTTMFVGCLFVLSGCSPAVTSYYAPSAVDGTLTHKGPSIIGPSNAIVFEQQGIEIEVIYKGYIQLQLFVPEGKTLSLISPKVAVSFDGVEFEREYIAEFVKFSDAIHGRKIVTKKFIGYKRENIFQRDGTTYIARIDIGEAPENFVVRLPVFETDSKEAFILSDVKFKHEVGASISPIN